MTIKYEVVLSSDKYVIMLNVRKVKKWKKTFNFEEYVFFFLNLQKELENQTWPWNVIFFPWSLSGSSTCGEGGKSYMQMVLSVLVFSLHTSNLQVCYSFFCQSATNAKRFSNMNRCVVYRVSQSSIPFIHYYIKVGKVVDWSQHDHLPQKEQEGPAAILKKFFFFGKCTI